MVSSSIKNDFQYWIAFLRVRFFRLSMREKVLTVLFVGALLGVWFSFQIERHGSARFDIRVANSTAKNQGDYLEQEAITEE